MCCKFVGFYRFTKEQARDSFGSLSRLLSMCAASQSDNELHAWAVKQNQLSRLLESNGNTTIDLPPEVRIWGVFRTSQIVMG